MGNNPVITGTGIKFKCHDMNFMAASDQTSRELPRPILQPATRGIESFEDEPDFHSDTASVRTNRRPVYPFARRVL